MEAIPVLTGLVGKRRRGKNGHGFPRLTRWYCRKKPPHLEQKFTDELEAHTTLTPIAEERLQEYYRRFDTLAIVGPELHKRGGYDPENEGGHRETRSRGGHDHELRSYMESRFEQIDKKIDKLLADRVHVPVPHVPVAPVPPPPAVPDPPQPIWSAGYTPTTSAGYTRDYAESSMHRYGMEEIGEQQVDEDEQQIFDEQRVDDDGQQVDDEQVNAQQAEVEVEDEQVDAQQGADNQDDEQQHIMTRRSSQRFKKQAAVVEHEQQVGDDMVDAQQGAENQNDDEADVVRRSKRIKKLASVVQTPYTVPTVVKNMVYERKKSRRS